VANAAITAEIHQPFDVHRGFATQVTLNDEIGDSRSQTGDFRFREVFYCGIRFYAGRVTDLLRSRVANAIDRRQPNHDVLVQWNIYACYSSHFSPVLFDLALTLLVPFVSTDHAHNTVASNDLAVSAHLSN
jgi:hypothetical protein